MQAGIDTQDTQAVATADKFLSMFSGTVIPQENTAKTSTYVVGEAALGKSVKYVRQKAEQQVISASAEARRLRFRLQKGGAQILGRDHAMNRCLFVMQKKDAGVAVNVVTDKETGKKSAHYTGLQTCGSVWSCPVCSEKISRLRVKELNKALESARSLGLIPLLVTLTARHRASDDLFQQVESLKNAKRRMRRHRAWSDFKDELEGTITATEVTHGVVNGWHTHFHELWFVKADSEEAALEAVDHFADVWLTCLRAEGLDGIRERAFQAQGAAEAGTYVAKWGSAEELALKDKKRGKQGGRSAMQLLHDAVINKDRGARSLWLEFSTVFKGRRQLVWSNGLKTLFGVDEVKDAQAAEYDDLDSEIVAVIPATAWNPFRFSGAKYRRLRILEAAEKHGAKGVWDEVQATGYDEELWAEKSQESEDLIDTS